MIPARLFGVKGTGGKVELLLVKQLGSDTWEAISKPGLKVGQKIEVNALYGLCDREEGGNGDHQVHRQG